MNEGIPRAVCFVRSLKVILSAVKDVAIDLCCCGGRLGAYHLAGWRVHFLIEDHTGLDRFLSILVLWTIIRLFSDESVSHCYVVDRVSLTSSMNPLGSELNRFAESAKCLWIDFEQLKRHLISYDSRDYMCNLTYFRLVKILPPIRSLASRITTSWMPRLKRWLAAERPAMPAPMTMTRGILTLAGQCQYTVRTVSCTFLHLNVF